MKWRTTSARAYQQQAEQCELRGAADEHNVERAIAGVGGGCGARVLPPPRKGLTLFHFSAKRYLFLCGTRWLESVKKAAQGVLRSGRMSAPDTRPLFGLT
jgi:hypothetical protein